jgi:hypothetical protein
MVKHGAISRAHVYRMLGSKDSRVRRAAFTLLEASNPRLRKDSELFMELVRFIWDANPSYDVYREFSKRHLFIRYRVHELISARLRIEKQRQCVPPDRCTEETGQPRRIATAVAMTECEIMRLEKAAMIGVLHEEPSWLVNCSIRARSAWHELVSYWRILARTADPSGTLRRSAGRRSRR